jgi:COG2932: predicted transcriptional regulator
MATPDEIRKKIDSLIKSKGLNYAQVSKMLGRGVAFMQQYITNGSPLRLKETDRKNLSQILEVNEQELTDLSLDLPFPGKLNILEGLFAKNNSTGTVQIDIISATACCGSGNEILAEDITGHWIIPQADFHTLPFSAAPNNIKMLRVSGDSMEPTLKDGDWILADISRKSPDSDGIYLLQLSTGLAVKRLQGSITPDTIIIKSDNPVYNPENANLKDVIILGRVIYILKTEKVG